LLESSIRLAEVGSPNHHAALEPRKRHAPRVALSFYRRCDPPARDRRRYRHQARQSQLPRDRDYGLSQERRQSKRPRTCAPTYGRDIAFRLEDLRAWHLVRASFHQCSHKAAIAHASLLQGRPGYTRLITLERSGARAALSHPCRDVVSGAGAAAGRAQIRSLIAMAQRQSPEIAAFPCVDPVETAADKLSALA
jgi:hypothetical protein